MKRIDHRLLQPKLIYVFGMLIILLATCAEVNGKQPNKPTESEITNHDSIDLDSVREYILHSQKEGADTVSYTCDLLGLSTEGLTSTAFYQAGSIRRLDVVAFGETGKLILHFLFADQEIFVADSVLQYTVALEDVYSEDDYILREAEKYAIDCSGARTDGQKFKHLELFGILKENIPFDLSLK